MAETATTDRELVQETLDGNKAAFGDLVRRYHHKVYGLVYHMTHSREDAEDLTQEAFLRAYRGLKSFGFRSDFYTWLYRIAVNVTLNFLRRSARRSRVSTEGLPPSLLKASNNDGPGAQAEFRQLYERLMEGIQALTPDLRAALVLTVFQGLRYREASEVLGCAEGTVAWRVSEARQQLRRYLNQKNQGQAHAERDGLQPSETETL